MLQKLFSVDIPMYGLAQIVALGHRWVHENLWKPALRVHHQAKQMRYDKNEYYEICCLLGDLALVLRAWRQAKFWYEKAIAVLPSSMEDLILLDDIIFVSEQAGNFRTAHRYQRISDSKYGLSPSRPSGKRGLSRVSRREGHLMSLLFQNSPRSVLRKIAVHTSKANCAMRRRAYGVKQQAKNFLWQMKHDLTTWHVSFDESDFFFCPEVVLDWSEFWQQLQDDAFKVVIPDLGIWENSNDWNASNTSIPIFYDRRHRYVTNNEPMYRQISTAILPLHIARTKHDLQQMYEIAERYPGWITPKHCLNIYQICGCFPSWYEMFTQRLPFMKEKHM